MKNLFLTFWITVFAPLILLPACTVNSPVENTNKTVGVAIPLSEWKQQVQYTEVEGHRIAYWEAGKGEALILVHGFPASAWSWQFIMPELAKHYRVIAPDLLGYGLSDKPWPHDYKIGEQADIIMGLTKNLGINTYHLMGHDFGASTVQELLARHNEAEKEKIGFIESVSFLNGGLFAEQQRYTLSLKLAVSPVGPYLTRLMSQWKYNRDIRDTFGEHTQPTQEQLDGSWELITRDNGKPVMAALTHAKLERDIYRDRWVGAIQQAKVPVRLIDGLADKLSGKHMVDHYEKLIPNPDTVRIEKVGHWPQLEAPEKVIEAYLAFKN